MKVELIAYIHKTTNQKIHPMSYNHGIMRIKYMRELYKCMYTKTLEQEISDYKSQYKPLYKLVLE